MDSEKFHVTFIKPIFIPLFFLFCWLWLLYFWIFLIRIDLHNRGNLIFILCYILFIFLGLILFSYKIEIINGDIFVYLFPFVKFKITRDRIKDVKVFPGNYKELLPLFWGCFLIVKIKKPFPYIFPIFVTMYEVSLDEKIKKVIEYYNEGEQIWKNSM